METTAQDPRSELIRACRTGDRKAQHQLYKLYVKAMYNAALRIVQNEDDAADVIQEAFIEAFTNLDRYREESSFGYWIKQIVINKAISHWRKNRAKTWPQIGELSEAMDAYHDPEQVEYAESDILLEVERIKQAITRLPDGYRMVITLYLLEGYDHEEIGEILAISEATSRTQFMRGKRKLLELLTVN